MNFDTSVANLLGEPIVVNSTVTPANPALSLLSARPSDLSKPAMPEIYQGLTEDGKKQPNSP